MQWWGYKHTNGTYQAKRFFGQIDLDEAEQSPFVAAVTGPFEAVDRDDAIRQIEEDLK